MSLRCLRTSVILAIFVTLPLFAAGQKRNKAPRVLHPVEQEQPAPQEQQTTPAVVPTPTPTPEQGPSSPPEVTFQGGRLTIMARNSTMSDVLNAVKKKTGAAVDMPAVSSERVAGVFGPGAPREVIAQLLNGSHYDYVLLGSPAEPGALKKIVLMIRPTGPEPTPPPQAAAQMNTDENLQTVPEVEDQTSQDVSPDVQPEMPPGEVDQPQGDVSAGEQPQGAPSDGRPVVKTPEQLLRELQQQQQQQQNGQTPPQ